MYPVNYLTSNIKINDTCYNIIQYNNNVGIKLLKINALLHFKIIFRQNKKELNETIISFIYKSITIMLLIYVIETL